MKNYKVTKESIVYSKKYGTRLVKFKVSEGHLSEEEAIEWCKNNCDLKSNFVKEGVKLTAKTSGLLYAGNVTISPYTQKQSKQ